MPKRSRSGLVSCPCRVVAPTRVKGGSWIFRSILSGTHAGFAGMGGKFGPENVGNLASIPTTEVYYPEGKWRFNEDTNAANIAANFGSTESNFTMEVIGQSFGHEMPNPDAMPPCYERHAFDFKMNYTDGTPARVKYPADEHPQAKQFADEPSASPRSPSAPLWPLCRSAAGARKRALSRGRSGRNGV